MQLKQIFLTAVENHSPDDWGAYLEQACGDDRQLRERVSALLEAHTQQNPLFDDAGVFAVQASERLFERPGMMIGPFRILEEIGEGGFGVIFLCEQIEPIRRRVAVKVLKPGLDSRQVVARFEAERQALAMMEHPNIARVLDAGLAPSGRPYFAMELVQGIPITEYFDEQQLSIPKRLELFIDICAAVQHSHLKGIIHRDLKPSNIMVAQTDGRAVVKVIDFGIAKATGNQRLTDKTLITNILGFIGTPAYMSPEQIALTEVDVDIRSDVYALGVLLYETLTGETPFDSKTLQSVGYDEMRRLIRDCEPPRPSAHVSALSQELLTIAAANRQVEPDKLSFRLKRELDWIVMKAIEKDRSRRYQSASEMAEDIECFLGDAPVRACPPSSMYQLKKFARRHQVALITTGLVATALVVGSFLSLWQANQAHRAMRRADQSLENEKQALVRVLKSESNLQRQLYANET
ncbi:MAG: serine/threonine-protein kinase, partial [Pirellula sp.]